MLITNEVPSSWKDLQDKVYKYLNQCGYRAESPKTIELVRGQVEVDVFATTDNELLRQFICECKFWDTPVPREKIHAFRTIVQDSGSMLGIFISKKGFQSGAREAAYCSNVVLKDWNGFIDMIATKWVKNRFREIQRLGDPLGIYTDYLDVPIEKFSTEAAKQECFRLQNKYIKPYFVARALELGMHRPEEPIVIDDIQFDYFNCLFDYLEEEFIQGVKEFEELFMNNPIEGWKLDYSDRMHYESCITEYIIRTR